MIWKPPKGLRSPRHTTSLFQDPLEGRAADSLPSNTSSSTCHAGNPNVSGSYPSWNQQFTPENWWLEMVGRRSFPCGKAFFSGALAVRSVSFRECRLPEKTGEFRKVRFWKDECSVSMLVFCGCNVETPPILQLEESFKASSCKIWKTKRHYGSYLYIYIYTVYIIVYIHTIFINYHCKSSTCLPWKSDVWLIRIQQTKHDFIRGLGKTLVHNTSWRLVEGPSSKWTNNFPTVAGFGQPPNLNKRQVPNVKGWQFLVCELVQHLNI